MISPQVSVRISFMEGGRLAIRAADFEPEPTCIRS